MVYFYFLYGNKNGALSLSFGTTNMKSMKRFLIAIFVILLSKLSYAQSGRFTVGFATGPSAPVGAFGNHNINSSYAGFAKSGLNINGSFGFRLTEYAGIGVMVTS